MQLALIEGYGHAVHKLSLAYWLESAAIMTTLINILYHKQLIQIYNILN